jgi:non-ribosomal peptide synthetase component F
MSYWRRQLEGAAVLELPTDRPRPLRRRYKAAANYFALDPSLSEMVKGLAKREGVTLFMLLLAAFKGLLHRYSGQDDLCVGAPIAGRDSSQIRPLVGLFVNTLVLRTIIPENPTFRELLKRVRQVCLEAYARPEIPFEKLVAELQQDRDLSHHPLFQVWFVLQNIPASKLRMKEIELGKMRTETQTTNFDLTFSIADTDRLTGSITYDTELFDPETITEFLRRYEALLTEVVSNPQKRLLEIELDAGEETRSISDGTCSPLSADLKADFAF